MPKGIYKRYKNQGFQKGHPQFNHWKGKKHSKKSNIKNSESHKGKKYSDETKRKLSEARKREWKLGIRKGHLCSEETKQKMRLVFKREKSYLWRGGKSFEEYGLDWEDDLKESIRKKDNYICQICGIHQNELDNWYKKLDIHHKDYNKKNLNPDNLISLCRSCHVKTNQNRDYWLDYFKTP